jgi:hypothetical protein
MRVAPFCLYSMSTYLPALPAMPKQEFAADISERRDLWADEFNQERVERARQQLQLAAAPAKARATGSRRRVSTAKEPQWQSIG